MKGSIDERLKMELKKLIVEECDVMTDPGDISDEEPLFGRDSRLGLDSIDALQISIAVKIQYNIIKTDSQETNRDLK